MECESTNDLRHLGLTLSVTTGRIRFETGCETPKPGRPSGRRASEESNREFTVSNFLSETKCWLSVLTQEVGKVKYE